MSGFVPSQVDTRTVIESRAERAQRREREGTWTAIAMIGIIIWALVNRLLGV